MTKYVLWTFLLLALVLVVTHASGFASAVSSVGGFALGESNVLSGNTNKGTSGQAGVGNSSAVYGFNSVSG
jgi:hypothetical protein